MGNSSKRTARAVTDAEKMDRALKLRIAGASYAQVAAELGYSDKSGARKLLERAIASIPAESLVEHRKVASARLEAAMLAMWNRVKGGDLAAIRTFVQTIETHMRIQGYAAPVKNEHTGADGGPIVTASARDELLLKLESLAARGTVVGAALGAGSPAK